VNRAMTILDAYVLRRVLITLAFVFVAFIGIFVLIDLFDHAHTFIDNEVPVSVVLLYYIYSIPWIVVLTAPIAMLLATLLSVGGLSRKNEIMAMKGSGLSLYRVLAPVLALGALLSVVSLTVGETALPNATRKKMEIETAYIDSRRPDPRIRSDVTYIGADGTMYLIRRYNVRNETMEEVTIEEFDAELRPTTRIDALRGQWEQDRWVLSSGRIRRFAAEGQDTTPFEQLELGPSAPSPADLSRRKLEPEEMGYRELRAHIQRLRAGGNDPTALLVELRLKIAFPFVTVIMTLLGAPLAAGTRRSGFAMSFTAALAISFLFYGLIRVGQILGQQGILPPAPAVWIGNVTFAAIGLVILVKTPK
jgi:lipopolysaccharide export system permease protein